jgi:hypothetical protein
LKNTPQAAVGFKPLRAGNEPVRGRNRRLCDRNESLRAGEWSLSSRNESLRAGERSLRAGDRSVCPRTGLLRAREQTGRARHSLRAGCRSGQEAVRAVVLNHDAIQAIADVGPAFGDPPQHRGLGLRKLARRSYEVRVHLQWRVVFIYDGKALIAYDVMNHDEVSLWLRGQRK